MSPKLGTFTASPNTGSRLVVHLRPQLCSLLTAPGDVCIPLELTVQPPAGTPASTIVPAHVTVQLVEGLLASLDGALALEVTAASVLDQAAAVGTASPSLTVGECAVQLTGADASKGTLSATLCPTLHYYIAITGRGAYSASGAGGGGVVVTTAGSGAQSAQEVTPTGSVPGSGGSSPAAPTVLLLLATVVLLAVQLLSKDLV